MATPRPVTGCGLLLSAGLLAADWAGSAIMAGRKSFHNITVSALYIGAEDNVPAPYDKSDLERAPMPLRSWSAPVPLIT